MIRHPAHPSTQQGAALAVILIFLLVMAIAVFSGLTQLNEHQRAAALAMDHTRAMAQAQALLIDAERDLALARRRPPLNWPLDAPARTQLQHQLQVASGRSCAQGICVPASATSLDPEHWRNLQTDTAFWRTGARLGQYSGTPVDVDDVDRARYWIEILPLEPTTPGQLTPFVYRITAVSLGQQDGTRVVLQSMVVIEAQHNSAGGQSTRRLAWREVWS